MRKLFLNTLTLVLLTAILLGAIQMILLTLPYTALGPGIDFLKTKAFIYHKLHWRLSFYVHVFTGIFALLAGLTQFSRTLLVKFPKLHRMMGYAYVINVLLITGPAALVMSFYANGGWPAKTSFILQSIAWIFCTAMALKQARTGRFEAHGNWMLLSFSLTLAALTLRSYAALLAIAGSNLRPVDKYTLIAWASWVPNLLVAGLLIRLGFIRRMMHAKRTTELDKMSN
jgi:hypothetical protein